MGVRIWFCFFAIFIPKLDFKMSFTINYLSTIFTAESMATLRAYDIIFKQNINKFISFSDLHAVNWVNLIPLAINQVFEKCGGFCRQTSAIKEEDTPWMKIKCGKLRGFLLTHSLTHSVYNRIFFSTICRIRFGRCKTPGH